MGGVACVHDGLNVGDAGAQRGTNTLCRNLRELVEKRSRQTALEEHAASSRAAMLTIYFKALLSTNQLPLRKA